MPGKKIKKYFLIPICGMNILGQSLPVMVFLAKRLPVTSIPKQALISSMRNDVVYHSRLPVSAFLLAHHTQGVRGEVLFPGLLPCSVVSAASRTAHLLRMEGLVLFTELSSAWHKRRTSRMSAGDLRSRRHFALLSAPPAGHRPPGRRDRSFLPIC